MPHTETCIYQRQTVSRREERKGPFDGMWRRRCPGLLVITGLVFWSAAQIQLALITAVHILGTSQTLKGNSGSSGAPDPVFPSYPKCSPTPRKTSRAHDWFISANRGVISLQQLHFSFALISCGGQIFTYFAFPAVQNCCCHGTGCCCSSYRRVKLKSPNYSTVFSLGFRPFQPSDIRNCSFADEQQLQTRRHWPNCSPRRSS